MSLKWHCYLHGVSVLFLFNSVRKQSAVKPSALILRQSFLHWNPGHLVINFGHFFFSAKRPYNFPFEKPR